MKFKKLVSVGISDDIIDKKYWDMLSEIAEVRVALDKDSYNIDEELEDADGLLVWFNGADKTLLDKAPKLKYVGALATGVGKIDVAYAASKGIVVTNIPGYSTEGVAELVIAVLLENLRDLCRGKSESKTTRTSESGYRGREIKGKDFGVIGLGKIGSRVAELASAFEADVFFWSHSPKPEAETKYKYEDFDKLITHCDFLSINLALNNETEGIINAERLAKIKNGAIVINTAPLELLDLNALDESLANKKITFIFDHTDPDDISDEWLERLREHDNCITYPVLGYITDESKVALQEIFVNNAKSFLEGKPTNSVS